MEQSLFDFLPEEDVKNLHRYLQLYGGGKVLPLNEMNYFLRFWSENKSHFFKMFDNQFIIKKEIFFEKSYDELYISMMQAMSNLNQKALDFRSNYLKKIRKLTNKYSDSDLHILTYFVNSLIHLTQNIYTGESFLINGKYTVDGRSLLVNNGCKTIKMLGKIARALGCEEGYEDFRKAHSLALNQKKIKGNLCLSIHPLDFLTMSDNDCGWTSCMSWGVADGDIGDYRLGTIEMMNSECVIEAYIEASEPMYINNEFSWNNKRWRQLFIVNEDLILGNKQYPYNNNEIETVVLNWLKDLCETKLGWNSYINDIKEIRNGHYNFIDEIDPHKGIEFSIETSGSMYNDVYDKRSAYVSKNIDHHYNLDFCGPAICVKCGEEIFDSDLRESSIVYCEDCDPIETCCVCGGRLYDEEDIIYVDDHPVCPWCYQNKLSYCDICGEPHLDHRRYYLELVDPSNKEYDESLNLKLYVKACYDCGSEELAKLFGPVEVRYHEFGFISHYAVKVKNFTKEGIDYCYDNFAKDLAELIEEIRDSNNEEELNQAIDRYYNRLSFKCP